MTADVTLSLAPLQERLRALGLSGRRLAVVMGQLGDFDSLEYAQVLVPRLDALRNQGITVQVFAIGDDAGADRFCGFTGFPRQQLQVDPVPTLHEQLGLERGLKLPGGP